MEIICVECCAETPSLVSANTIVYTYGTSYLNMQETLNFFNGWKDNMINLLAIFQYIIWLTRNTECYSISRKVERGMTSTSTTVDILKKL